jgi:hypothetical protein
MIEGHRHCRPLKPPEPEKIHPLIRSWAHLNHDSDIYILSVWTPRDGELSEAVYRVLLNEVVIDEKPIGG